MFNSIEIHEVGCKKERGGMEELGPTDTLRTWFQKHDIIDMSRFLHVSFHHTRFMHDQRAKVIFWKHESSHLPVQS
jgi:hypothetical protein